MKTQLDIKKLLNLAKSGPSRWELDNITWYDRTSNPKSLRAFLERIQLLSDTTDLDIEQQAELTILIELADEMDQDECAELLSNDDDIAQNNFIEALARKSAIEVLTNEKIEFETMNTLCKLTPTDFILTSKRTQDLINAIHELVIQGETLSTDVAGA